MIYYDFHIHSCLSPCGDNDMTPNNIVNMAALSGLDTIAISDHNTIGNVKAAMEFGESCGVNVIPGMEVETSEEVHILTLYPSLEAAEVVAKEVYKRLPDIKNKTEIFGEQVYMDCDDNIVGYEDRLLISPANITFDELYDLVKSVGGLFIPAHVDRHSYSVLTNLGFIPEEFDIKFIEVSTATTDLESYLQARSDLKKYKVFRNSDAHYLENMSMKDAFLDIDNIQDLF